MKMAVSVKMMSKTIYKRLNWIWDSAQELIIAIVLVAIIYVAAYFMMGGNLLWTQL